MPTINWFRGLGEWEWAVAIALGLLVVLLSLSKFWVAAQLGSRHRYWLLKPLMRILAFVFFFIAFLGPSTGSIQKEMTAKGKDIMILLDLSRSMNAQDIAPSRLSKIKYVLKELNKTFQSDRVGLIIFSDRAFMQCPLTYDKNALDLFVESLHTDLVPTAGTEFAPALEMAKEKLLQDDERPGEQAKIALLISDGEDHGDASVEAAEALDDAGIQLFTLGIGTLEGAPIPGKLGYVKNEQNEIVTSALNNEKLKELAKAADGNYFEITKSKNETDLLVNAIEREEGAVRDLVLLDVTANQYKNFLWAAFLLLALDLLLPLRVIKL